MKIPKPDLMTLSVVVCEIGWLRCQLYGEPANTRMALMLTIFAMFGLGLKRRLDRIEAKLDARPAPASSESLLEPSRN